MRFSVVRISLVRSLKKIQKNLAYADFHQSPSLVRKICHMLIFIKVLHLCCSYILPILTIVEEPYQLFQLSVSSQVLGQSQSQ